MALIASRLHLMWVATVCGKLKTDFRYSNTLGWNTFPVPKLTEKNKKDLVYCAENILLAREKYFPKTISELYEQDRMPHDLKDAHFQNDVFLLILPLIELENSLKAPNLQHLRDY